MPKTLYYEDAETGLKLKGLPDEYLDVTGVIVPFDHKTKSKAPTEVHPSYQLQLDCYTFLLEKNGFKTINKAYLAFYYPEDCEIHDGMDIKVEIVEVKTNPEIVLKLIEKAFKVLNGEIPIVNDKCNYCNYRERKDG
jgi:CRISPR/Cas system-associated exonuclease Cas4 (RecB family)